MHTKSSRNSYTLFSPFIYKKLNYTILYYPIHFHVKLLSYLSFNNDQRLNPFSFVSLFHYLYISL